MKYKVEKKVTRMIGNLLADIVYFRVVYLVQDYCGIFSLTMNWMSLKIS